MMQAKIGTLNPFRYKMGYYYDNESGLFYVGSRYYDSNTCRFINADSVVSGTGEAVQGYNLFAYCDNNPVNNCDPTGNWKVPNWVKGALAVAGGVCQVIAGVAICSGAGWTGVGAVLGAALIFNGGFAVAAGAAQVVNDVINTDYEEENLLRVAAGEIGNALGGETGESVAETVYDVADTAAAFYSIVVGGPEAFSKTLNVLGKTNKITKSSSLSFAKVSKFTNNYEIKLAEGVTKCIKLPKAWLRGVDGVGAGIDTYNQGKKIVGKIIEIFGGDN